MEFSIVPFEAWIIPLSNVGSQKVEKLSAHGRKNDTKDWNHDHAEFFSSATVTVAIFFLLSSIEV